MPLKELLDAALKLIQGTQVELVNVLCLLVIGLVGFVCALAWRVLWAYATPVARSAPPVGTTRAGGETRTAAWEGRSGSAGISQSGHREVL
jgi:hypothetical protein